jgi:hypothetical protein
MTHGVGMPGPIHDGLLALLLNSRKLAFELAARCGARLHGEHEELRQSSEVFCDPGDPGRLFIADGVLIGWANLDGNWVEVDGVVIEIQMRHDELKLISWVIYRAGVRSRHRCRAWTLVLSPEPDVRRRAREMFEHEPELCPLIVEPDLIPKIIDFSQARHQPELTLLSAVMHARSDIAVACGRAALVALLAVPPELRQCYLDMLSATLTEEQMSEAAKQVPPEVEIELSPLELGSYAYTRGVREGREAGVQEGREEGVQEGREVLLTTLHATLVSRGIELDQLSHARVEQCQDLGQLSRWLVRAATANCAADLFE